MIKLIKKEDGVSIDSNWFTDFEPDSILFLGMRTVATGSKPNSQEKFYHTLPIEHTDLFPVEISVDGDYVKYDQTAHIWLAQPLIKALSSGEEKKIDITVEKYADHDSIIILNCLDSCYGHALDKLFNIQRHLNQDTGLGLLVIIQSSMRHLVPDGVSEIWMLDTPFKTFEYKIAGFDQAVKSRISKTKNAYLSRADMNLDYSLLHIQKFVKQTPIPFEKLLVAPLQILFILREDRFWLTTRINQFLYLVVRKFRLMAVLRGYFIFLQNKNFRRLSKVLNNMHPGTKITAVGIGGRGRLGKFVNDLREPYSKYKTHESERYELYANSHLVIGVHGSHMILPSALAGTFISLHQEYKIPHFSEDFIPRYSCPQRQAFLGRFLADINTPGIIASHINHMFTQLKYTEKTKC